VGAKLGVGLGLVVLGVVAAGCGGSGAQQGAGKPAESTTAAPPRSAVVPVTHGSPPYQFGEMQAKAPLVLRRVDRHPYPLRWCKVLLPRQ